MQPRSRSNVQIPSLILVFYFIGSLGIPAFANSNSFDNIMTPKNTSLAFKKEENSLFKVTATLSNTYIGKNVEIGCNLAIKAPAICATVKKAVEYLLISMSTATFNGTSEDDNSIKYTLIRGVDYSSITIETLDEVKALVAALIFSDQKRTYNHGLGGINWRNISLPESMRNTTAISQIIGKAYAISVNSNDLMIGQELSPELVRKIKTFFNIPYDDIILIFFNNAWLSEGKFGFVITLDGIFWKNGSSSKYLSWYEMRRKDYEIKPYTGYVQLNYSCPWLVKKDRRCNDYIKISSSDMRSFELVGLIKDIGQFIFNPPTANALPVRPVPTKSERKTTPVPTYQARAYSSPKKYAKINTEKDPLTLRRSPVVRKDNRIISIPKNTKVEIVSYTEKYETIDGKKHRWIKVKYKSEVGYVFGAYLKFL